MTLYLRMLGFFTGIWHQWLTMLLSSTLSYLIEVSGIDLGDGSVPADPGFLRLCSVPLPCTASPHTLTPSDRFLPVLLHASFLCSSSFCSLLVRLFVCGGVVLLLISVLFSSLVGSAVCVWGGVFLLFLFYFIFLSLVWSAVCVCGRVFLLFSNLFFSFGWVGCVCVGGGISTVFYFILFFPLVWSAVLCVGRIFIVF